MFYQLIIWHSCQFKNIDYIMVNSRDEADASKNKTNEILTVYLLNLLAFITYIQE